MTVCYTVAKKTHNSRSRKRTPLADSSYSPVIRQMTSPIIRLLYRAGGKILCLGGRRGDAGKFQDPPARRRPRAV